MTFFNSKRGGSSYTSIWYSVVARRKPVILCIQGRRTRAEVHQQNKHPYASGSKGNSNRCTPTPHQIYLWENDYCIEEHQNNLPGLRHPLPCCQTCQVYFPNLPGFVTGLRIHRRGEKMRVITLSSFTCNQIYFLIRFFEYFSMPIHKIIGHLLK